MNIETFILISIIVLVVLAIGDIIVGVSNDAVNFLNSAIGSRVAPFKTIMTVASVGIFIGALSSAGMMEIARKGIINPEHFSLYEVIIIFVAVMITDVILLDFFNTIGIPTSTTISLIFELLGSAFIVSTYKVINLDEPLNYLLNVDGTLKSYLNWSKTNEIIFSIFLSVLLAFILGAIIQYISRILFTFNYKAKMKIVGVIWGAIAVTSMSYYLVYKGLKSTYSSVEVSPKEMKSYLENTNPEYLKINPTLGNIVKIQENGKEVTYELKDAKNPKDGKIYKTFYGFEPIKNIVDYVKDNLLVVLAIFLIFWIIIFSILNNYGINILKIVILSGTFCMAMAFAGNDLVNFIGVPVTAIQSLEIFHNMNGTDPKTFTMIGLKFPMQTPYLYLVISGLIMTATLWLSKKAKNVTETELKLSSQEENEERFSANFLSKGIVQFSMAINNGFNKVIPQNLRNKLNSRFIPLADAKEDAHFDLVRASVNLTVASILIAVGTDLKLPLSTTYVTFMVAMGTSLADRAWGRETAVYRIAGVFNVIGSWFLTGLGAFLGGAIVALVIISFEIYGLIFMVGVVIFILIRTSIKNNKKNQEDELSSNKLESISFIKNEIIEKSTTKISNDILTISTIYDLTINGILTEDKTLFKKAKTLLKELKEKYETTRIDVYKKLKKSKYSKDKAPQIYLIINNLMNDTIYTLECLLQPAKSHVENSHKPLLAEQVEIIKDLHKNVIIYLEELKSIIENRNFNSISKMEQLKFEVLDEVEKALEIQADGISERKFGLKNSNLMFAILLETKDVLEINYRFIRTFKLIIEEDQLIFHPNPRQK